VENWIISVKKKYGEDMGDYARALKIIECVTGKKYEVKQ
jgi:hypothetical protein